MAQSDRSPGEPPPEPPPTGGAPVDAPTAPPHDVHAEQSVLGAVLLRPDVMQEVGNVLKEDDFYLERHRAIYRSIVSLEQENQPIDSVLLMRRLQDRGELAAAGGAAYVTKLPSLVPTTANVGHYMSIVRERAVLRSLIEVSRSAVQDAHGDPEDVGELVDAVAQRMLGLALTGYENRVVHIRDALEPVLDAAEQRANSARRGSLTGIPSGFYALDKLTNGWQPGDLVILAARPGMGKTSFALNLLSNAAQAKPAAHPGVIFSLEMTKEQLATRLWCSLAQVSSEKIRTGDIADKDWDPLLHTVKALHTTPIFIDDTPSLPVVEMMRKCRQLRHEHRIGFAIVDYLQLMQASAPGRNTTREQVVSEISRHLKALAKELMIPVIALSQLNRSVEKRPNKKPILSDLRESGAIEQDADIIIFLHREGYYGSDDQEEERPVHSGSSPDVEPTSVIVAKHRSGPTGEVTLNFHKNFTLFTNILGAGPPDPDDGDIPPDMQARDDRFDYAAPAKAALYDVDGDDGGLGTFDAFDDFDDGDDGSPI